MIPEGAKVFLAEDEALWRTIVRQNLERASHVVLVQASSFERLSRFHVYTTH